MDFVRYDARQFVISDLQLKGCGNVEDQVAVRGTGNDPE